MQSSLFAPLPNFREQARARVAAMNAKVSDGQAARVALIRKGVFDIPPCHREPLENLQYNKVLFEGGRGGVKTTSVLTKFVEWSYAEKYAHQAFLCAREIQGSIGDSVMKDIEKIIRGMKAKGDFIITKTSIVNKFTNVQFIFSGLRATGGATAASQVNKLKGKSSVALVHIDEAQDISEASITVLMPTVNRGDYVPLTDEYRELYIDEEENPFNEDTRMFFTMNAELPEDPIKTELMKIEAVEAKEGTPPSVFMAHINIDDLPERYQDPQLMRDRAVDLAAGIHNFDNKWNGKPKASSKYPFVRMPVWSKLPIDETVNRACFIDLSGDGEDYTAQAFSGEYEVKEGDGLDEDFNVGDTLILLWGEAFKSSWNDCLGRLAGNIVKYGINRRYVFNEENFEGRLFRSKLKGSFGITSRAVRTENAYSKHEKICNVAATFTSGEDEVLAEVNRTCLVMSAADCCPVWVKMHKGYCEGVKHDDPPDATAMLLKKMYIPDEIKW